MCINPLPSDRLRCCDRYIRCQRSLAVKPLTMPGSPSPCVEWAGLRLPMYRYQTAAAPCVRWQLANWCRSAETTAVCRAATAALRVQWRFLSGRVRRLGPFSTAGARRLRAFVHYRSSHNRARSAIVACNNNNIIRKFIMRTCSQALSMNRRREDPNAIC